MKRTSILCAFAMSCACGLAQTDSSRTLEEVTVNAYPSRPLLVYVASSVSVIGQEQISDYTNQSLVPVMNSVPGVRMEERSPGSYRLSVRGSLLRSPFGIRNIKIYLDEFPLTDASGNTYLNLVNATSIHSVQIIKGPDGSMFGANTGGVVLLDSQSKDSTMTGACIGTGSYGLFDEQVHFDKKWKRYSLSVAQSFQHSDGYRENSALQRNYLQITQKWSYQQGEVKVLVLGSRLVYETPGGLTLLQAEANPRQARPATATLPGATEQGAGISNATLYAGVSNEYRFFSMFKHVLILFGSYTDFKNPFITNFETRKEQSAGIRSYVELGKKWRIFDWKWDLGLEWQQTGGRVANYDNNQGIKGELQASDDLKVAMNCMFTRFSLLVNNRVGIEAGLSLNTYHYRFKNTFPNPGDAATRKQLNPQFMPRIGISYRIVRQFVWRALVSKGYSPPTLAEIRPSDNLIYGELQSEYGWNLETGFRFSSLDRRWYADVSIFQFDLQQAIVRRVNESGAEYFVNAGGTSQQGLEFQFSGVLLKHHKQGFVRELSLRTGFTWYHFTFSDYSNASVSYSGNQLTGVPASVSVTSLKIFFPLGFNLFLSYNYTDQIPLNDDNSVFATSYHLLGTKLSWEYTLKNTYRLVLFAGVENILDTTYSLGNDLNAAGGRYYNPAPGRNYCLGLKVEM